MKDILIFKVNKLFLLFLVLIGINVEFIVVNRYLEVIEVINTVMF